MSNPFLGQITMFAGNFAPRGWALCQGQILPINQYQALYSLLGTTYGGDGRTSFGLPDLRGRTAIHPGANGVSLGNKGGAETVALNTNQIPRHTHAATLRANSGEPETSVPTGNVVAAAPFYQAQAPNVDMSPGAATVSSSGGTGHENMQPFQVINYIIALQGVFPSRN